MPRVPQTDNVVPMQPQAELPSPTLFAMAAAMMHEEGHLISSVPLPKADPRGSTFTERLPGAEDSGPYIDAAKFMNSRKQNTMDRVYDPIRTKLEPSLTKDL